MNLRTNSMLSLLGSVVPALTALALIPATLQKLGNEAFGVLSLMLALIGYFSVFDVGMSRALTYRMAKLWKGSSGAEDGPPASSKAVSGVLGTGLAITMGTALVGAVVVYLGAGFLVDAVLKLSPPLSQDAAGAMRIVAAGTLFVTLNSATRGALEGINRFAIANINKAVTGFGTFFVPYIVALQSSATPLSDMATALVCMRMLMCALETTQLLRATGISPAALRPNRKDAASLLTYGGWIVISNVLSPLMVYGDRFVVGAILGATPLPYYAIPQEGLQRLLIIPSAICSALMPRLTVAADHERMGLIKRFDRMNDTFMGGLCVVVGLVAYPFYSHWISEDFARQAIVPTLIMLAGLWLNANAMVKFVTLHAMGHTRVTALVHIAEFIAFFAILWPLTRHFGIAGAAAAWTLRMAADNLILRAVLQRRMETPVLQPGH